MRPRLAPPAGLAILVTLLGAAAASAAPPALLANGYWEGFRGFWLGSVQKQNGMVLMGLLLGTACILIIIKGKWKK